MARRHVGAAVVAALSSVFHQVAVAGEVAEGSGLMELSGPVMTIIDICFAGSVILIAAFVIPRILQLNIAVSQVLLAGLTRCDRLAEELLDWIRRGLLAGTERLVVWLRKPDRNADVRHHERER